MKKCFVIMPYGGSDEKMQKLFAGVYQSIVSIAARNAGYEPKRSDIAGEPGNITHDVIRALAEADIVVADLTSGNPNVFFELGIRHAFRKSGTVHIVNETQALPFDVSNYRVIKYNPSEISELPDAIRSIEEAIRKRELQPDRPDNPVHDALPELPLNIRAGGDRALLDQLRGAQDNVEKLRLQNEQLILRIQDIQPKTPQNDELDIDDLLTRADEAMKSKGAFGTLRLRQAIEEGGAEQFVTELRKVLKSPYLEPNDFMEIVRICRSAGLDVHRRAALEIAHQRFPDEESILLSFVSALNSSPNPEDRSKGLNLVEKLLGIEHQDGLPVFIDAKPNIQSDTALGVLFDCYLKIRRQDWVLAIIDGLPTRWSESGMVLRNRALSLQRAGRFKEAEEAYEGAIRANPRDEQSYLWYAELLIKQANYEKAYEYAEKAILVDPNDPSSYTSLAIDIMNHGYHRRLDGTVKGPAERKLRTKWAVPILLRALELNPSRDNANNIVSLLVRADAVEEAEVIASGGVPDGDYDTDPIAWIDMRVTGSSSAQTN